MLTVFVDEITSNIQMCYFELEVQMVHYRHYNKTVWGGRTYTPSKYIIYQNII